MSPGVDIQERDLTAVVNGEATTTGAFAGAFQWGVVGERVLVTSEDDLAARFGKPDNATAVDFFSAANFLAYANALQNVRVVGDLAVNSTSSGTGTLIKNEDDYLAKQTTLTTDSFVAKYAGILGNGLEVHIGTNGNFTGWAYESIFAGVPDADELHIVIIDGAGVWTGTVGTVLETYPYLSTTAGTRNDSGENIYFTDYINRRSSYVWVGALAPSFSPADAVDTETVATTLTAGDTQSYLTAAVAVTFTASTFLQTDTLVVTVKDAAGTRALTLATDYTITADDEITFVTPPTVDGDIFVSVGSAPVETVTLATETYTALESGNVAVQYDDGTNPAVTLVSGTDYTLVAPNQIEINHFVNADVAGDFIYTKTTAQFFSASLSGGVDDNANINRLDGYNLFSDAEAVDVSLVVTGGANQVEAEWILDNIGEERKDVVVFISPEFSDVVGNPNDEVTDSIEFRNQFNSSSYGFMDCNWKYQYDRYNDVFRWIPLNGDVAGLTARTEFVADAWFSPGGFNRGQIKNVTKLAYNPNRPQRDLLYKSGINPIVSFDGEGTILYGDKTMLARPSAFDRINVRRLFIVMEKSISRFAKAQLFEFNDDFTRAQFRNAVIPFLRVIQGRRGITGFRVIADDTNNDAQIVDTNNFVGDIYVRPNKSINFIQLNFIAVNNSVSFTEIG